MDNNQILMDEMLKKAKKALKEIESYSQEQVDALLKAASKAIADNAEILAKEAVEETGMGVLQDKIFKNTAIITGIYLSMVGKKSVGEIKREPEKGLIYYAKPKGVISAIIPTTNPTLTMHGNAMMALKGRNVIIGAPHPRAKKVTVHTAQLMNDAMKKLGAPDNLIQVIAEPTIESTQLLMKMSDVVVATGGGALVQAAYSSGKPAFGVGPGNVQCLIDRDADLDLAAGSVVFSRPFDLGITCAGEQCIHYPKDMADKVIAAFEKAGAFFVNDEASVAKFRGVLFPEGLLNPKMVGQSVQTIAGKAGVKVPESAKVIMLKPKGYGAADVLCKEKMGPIMIHLAYDKWEDAVMMARENLFQQGAGHSCTIYGNNDKNIDYAGKELPVGRILLNQPSVLVAGGPTNGLTPTCTLGCGSFGGNSISENLTYTHLLDTTIVGYRLEGGAMPSLEEIYG